MKSTRKYEISIGIVLLLLLLVNIDTSTANVVGRNHSYDSATKKAIVTEDGTPQFQIEQISSTPDLTTFEEEFNITFLTDKKHSIDLLGITTNHLKEKGTKEIDNATWYIQENVSYMVTESTHGLVENSTLISGITEAYNVTDAWNLAPRPVSYGSNTGKFKWNLTNKRTNFTPDWYLVGFDRHQNTSGDSYPINTIFTYNETQVIGTTTTTKYRNEWHLLDKKDPKKRSIGESVILKVVYHKIAEVGETKIQTIPTFYGVEVPEMTWWNASWNAVANNGIANGTRPYELSLNISNGTGTNNATHVFVSCLVLNCSDLRFTLDNTTTLSYWFETNTSNTSTWGKVWVNLTENGTVNMYYGNGVAAWVSNGTTVFTQWHGVATTNFKDTDIAIQPFIYEAKVRQTSGGTVETQWGVGDTANIRSGYNNTVNNLLYGTGNQRYFNTAKNTVFTAPYDTPIYTTNTWYNIRMTVASSSSATLHTDGYGSDLTSATNIPLVAMGLVMQISIGTGEQAYSFVRKYASPEPTWVTWSSTTSPTTPPAPTGISATVDLFYINTTWSAGTGNITETYNVSVNGTWTNGSSATFYKNSGLALNSFSNVTVYGYNSGGTGNLSTTATTLNTKLSFANRFDNAVSNGTRPYQLMLNISNNSAGLVGNSTYQNISCLAMNCSDLRFTLDNTTTLSYWFETNTSNTSTWGRVWVNVTGNGTVNMYYGNGVAAWVSNGTTTFNIFSSGKDYASWSGTTTNVNDELRFQGSGFGANTKTINLYRPFIVEARFKETTVANPSYNFMLSDGSGTSWGSNINIYLSSTAPTWQAVSGSNNIYTSYTYDTYYIFKESYISANNYKHELYDVNRSFLGSATGTNGQGTEQNPIPSVQIASGNNPVFNRDIYFTWLFFRNYASPEPVWVTWVSTTTPVPILTSWSNDATNNNSLTPRINLSYPIYFFATADQVIDTWSWFKDGVNQSSNTYDFTTSWNTLGTKNITLTAYNGTNGVSASKTWTVTVSDISNPRMNNETISNALIPKGTTVTISANFTDDTNISSSLVRLRAPNQTESEYSMSCTPYGNASICTHATADTLNEGTYIVLWYKVTDGSAHALNFTSSLTYMVSSAPSITSRLNSITNNDTLIGIRANISTSIGFSITTNQVIQSSEWFKDGVSQGDIGLSYTTSWNTLGNKNISVVVRNQYGTSLTTTWLVNISDVTAPWLTSSNTNSDKTYVQGYPVTIIATFSDDTNISSVKARINNPDDTEANWTMTCGISGSTATCTLAYATTINIGTYLITSFYPVDGTGNSRNITSTLSFTTTPPSTGGSTGTTDQTTGGGGGDGGGSGATQQQAIVSTTLPQINFTDVRAGATEPMAIDIASCLTDSLIMTNKCSSYNYGVVVEPFNWWVAIGAYVASLGVIAVQTIRFDKKRDWLKEVIIYGTFTVVISAILVSVGFNVYIVNYLMDSPKYFWTFINFGIWGTLFAYIGDSYYYRKDKKAYKLKKKISILEEL